MAFTLHNIQALANHMDNEDSFMWLTKQVHQSNFDVKSYEDKNAFLNEWHDIELQHKIYQKDTVEVYKAFKRDSNENQENDKSHCIVKLFHIQQNNAHQMSAIKATYLLMQKTNLLTFYGLYYDPLKDCMLMTMEPLQQTLEDYVQSYPITHGRNIQERECKLIVSYLLYDLWMLHKTGYIHCDINPSNIMLRDLQNTPTLNGWRIIDYENRLFIGDNAYVACKEVRGCICWTPPESYFQPTNSKKKRNCFYYGTDIWSIGIIILYILFGTQPFELSAKEQREFSNKTMCIQTSHHKKLLQYEQYEMNSDANRGEIWLRNYLICLYVENKISLELFDLLHDFVLLFDPRKRANCKTIWFHPWFDEYRELCQSMSDQMDCL